MKSPDDEIIQRFGIKEEHLPLELDSPRASDESPHGKPFIQKGRLRGKGRKDTPRPMEQVYGLSLGTTGQPTLALADTGSSICVAGSPAFFSSQCMYDPTLATATSAVAGSHLNHKHCEWLNTSFCDPTDKDNIVCSIPMLWRYEPEMTDQVIFSPGVITRALKNSRTVLAGTAKAADDPEHGPRTGIHIFDDDGRPVVHLPVISKGDFDYFCVMVTPIDRRDWPQNNNISCVDLSGLVNQDRSQKVYTVGEKSHIDHGTVGMLGELDVDEGNDLFPPLSKEELGSILPATNSREVRVQQRVGQIRRAPYMNWHAVLLHKSKVRILQTLRHATGASLTNTNNSFLCTTCVQGKGKLPNKKPTGSHMHAALEEFLGPGVAMGLTDDDVKELKISTLNYLKGYTPKALNYKGAMEVQPVAKARAGILQPMETIFADLLGPYLDRKRKKVYLMFVVCRSTHHQWVFQIGSKAAALDCIGEMVGIANTLQLKIKKIVTDPAGEHQSEHWKRECMMHGIKTETLMARSQQGNYAERRIQEIKADWRCMLIHGMLPLKIYALEIIHAVIYLSNRLAAESLGWLSPHFLLYGIPPDFSKVQTPGSIGWVIQPHSLLKGGRDYEPGGLGRKAVEGVLVGFTPNGHYRMRIFKTGRILQSQNVSFEDLTQPRRESPSPHRLDDVVDPTTDTDGVYADITSAVRNGYAADDSQVGSLGPNGEWKLFTEATRVAPDDFVEDTDINNFDDDLSSSDDEDPLVDVVDEPEERHQIERPSVLERMEVRRHPRIVDVPLHQQMRHMAIEEKEEIPPFPESEPTQERLAPDTGGPRRSTRSNRGMRAPINVSQEYADNPNTPVMGGGESVNALRSESGTAPDWFLIQESEPIEQDYFDVDETSDANCVVLDFDANNRIKQVAGRLTGGKRTIPNTLLTQRDSGLHRNNPDYHLQERLAEIDQKQARANDLANWNTTQTEPSSPTSTRCNRGTKRAEDKERKLESVHKIKTKQLTYRDAIGQNPDPEDQRKFQEALNAEWLGNLVGLGAVQYTSMEDVPEGTRVVPMIAAYSRKTNPITGKPEIWKCRICLRGDLYGPEHVHKDDFGNQKTLYAPTADLTVAKMVIGIGARENVSLAKFDIKAAFTNASVGAEVFASTVQGCHRYDKNGAKQVVRIVKNLYGSPDAARRWIDLAITQLLRMGFRRSLYDPCLLRICLPNDVAKKEMAAWEADKDMDKRDEPPKLRYPYPREARSKGPEISHHPVGAENLRQLLGTMPEEHEAACKADEEEDFHHLREDDLILNQADNWAPDHSFGILSLYVDDGLIASNSKEFMRYLIRRILQRFPGTSEEDPTSFLGFVFGKKSGKLMLTQDQLIKTTLADCKMGSSNRSNDVPMTSFITPDKTEHSAEYQKAIEEEVNAFRTCGQIGWLKHTLPGLAFTHAQLTRGMSNFNIDHVKATRRFCRWLQGQYGRGMTYNPPEDKGLWIFADTGLDVSTFTGVTVHFAGAVIYSKCMRQKFKTLHTMESEMAGLNEAAKVAIRLQACAVDCGEPIGTVTIYGDNEAAVNQFQKGAPECVSNKARHLRLRYHWTKQLVDLGLIRFAWIPTKSNIADLATKPVPKDLWQELYPQLMGTQPVIALAGHPTMTELYGPIPSPDTGG